MKNPTFYPEPAELFETFREEIENLNGTAAHHEITPNSLFLRATLPDCRDVRNDDWIRHGVAVRTDKTNLVVHPYTFREVCSNGAIHIENIASKVIELQDSPFATAGVDYYFREAIQCCASPEAFETNLADMREAMSRGVELAITMSSMMRQGMADNTMTRVITRFLEADDHSGFGLMNAITATAREEEDQEEKWRLESIGGSIIAWLEQPVPEAAEDYARCLPVEVVDSESGRYADIA